MSTSTIEKLILVVTALLEALLKLMEKKNARDEKAVEQISQVCNEHGLGEDIKAELIDFV